MREFFNSQHYYLIGCCLGASATGYQKPLKAGRPSQTESHVMMAQSLDGTLDLEMIALGQGRLSHVMRVQNLDLEMIALGQGRLSHVMRVQNLDLEMIALGQGRLSHVRTVGCSGTETSQDYWSHSALRGDLGHGGSWTSAGLHGG